MTTVETVPQPRFAVQVGTYQTWGNAEGLAEELHSRYQLETLVTPLYIATQTERHASIQTLHRVRVPVGTKAEAEDWQTRPRTADRNYWLLTGVAVGLTVADIELTQHCLHQGTCHEGNPLVPTTNRAKLYPLQLGVTAAQSYLAYRLKRKGSKAWWLPQFSLSASHAVGVGFGLRFVWGE